MKNIFRLFAIIAFVAVIGFSFAACEEDNGGGGYTEPKIYTFTSIAEFAAWLAAQPYNGAETAYNVRLNVDNLGGNSETTGSAGNALYIYTDNYKYVALDLSGSTFTSIGNKAFWNCRGLTSVTIPKSVTSIGNEAFWQCNSLTSVTIPASVISIGDEAFALCQSLTSVTIPKGVTSIGKEAFWCCNYLTSVTIPAGVTSMGDAVFLTCYRLTEIKVDTANTAYSSQDGVLYNKAKTNLIQYPIGKTNTTFTIPNGVTRIGQQAFSHTSLTSVTIPNSVTSIGTEAFVSCQNLTSVTIPASVTRIENSAFYHCNALTSVTFVSGSNITDTDFGYYNFFPAESEWGEYDYLKSAYSTGKAGTYTREGVYWTKTS